jgi:hypothetical protein
MSTLFEVKLQKLIMHAKCVGGESMVAAGSRPQNISEYFGNSPQDYASSYDTVVLKLEEIEESPTGSAKDMNTDDSFLGPEELSNISIANLLAKVKGNLIFL